MKRLVRMCPVLILSGFVFYSCEGPIGQNGQDANETCKDCHNPTVVDSKVVEFKFSKHQYGEAAFEEGGNTACAPCHEQEGFKFVCKNSIPATFTLNATTGKYSNDYVATTSIAYGVLSCFTCHSSIHSTYTGVDFFPLTNTAAVPMTMWKATKTIDITQKDRVSNLCVKCHQPRPITTSTTLSNGDVIDYSSLATSPLVVFYDNVAGNAAPNKVVPSYRFHVHYGTVGAIFAGIGGVQFTGSLPYQNSTHTTLASCPDCHMAPITGIAGGHTFVAKGNFNGCNATGCHGASTVSATNATYWTTPRADIKTLLNSVATKINAVGGAVPILHSDPSIETNFWAGLTTGNFDGYLDVYDPSTNAAGKWRNPAPSNTWTQPQKDANTALPLFPSLKNVTVGAMINFQMCLREYSSGIHNYKYAKALLQNSVEALTAAGY